MKIKRYDTINRKSKKYHMMNKSFVIYVKNELVMIIKNGTKFKVTVILPGNKETLHIISVT